jgi:hypothetical protein
MAGCAGMAPFGRVLRLDRDLVGAGRGPLKLTVRRREDGAIHLASAPGRWVIMTTSSAGFGPDRILVEHIPPESLRLPTDGWVIDGETMIVPYVGRWPLVPAEKVVAPVVPSIRDFPGHMRLAINRVLRPHDTDLAERLSALMQALPATIAEALELPVIGLIGWGGGAVPAGDLALAGVLLTGRVLTSNRRSQTQWHGRLAVDIRRFLHRTTPIGRATLLHALGGRLTERQSRLFEAMTRDFEGANDLAVAEISVDPILPGGPFLAGVLAVLERVQADQRLVNCHGRVCGLSEPSRPAATTARPEASPYPEPIILQTHL